MLRFNIIIIYNLFYKKVAQYLTLVLLLKWTETNFLCEIKKKKKKT